MAKGVGKVEHWAGRMNIKVSDVANFLDDKLYEHKVRLLDGFEEEASSVILLSDVEAAAFALRKIRKGR